MNDYVLVPSYIVDVNNIHSNNLKSFFNTIYINDEKFSLDELRKMYVNNISEFLKVRDELILRGFQFFTKKPNNILPSFFTEATCVINVSENNNFFKKINFEYLGLSGFIKRFNIDNDLFFHEIPLTYFKYINGNVNLKELTNEFKQAGFQIINIGPIYDNEIKIKTLTNNEETMKTHYISDVFKDNKYNTFRQLCYKKEA